LKLKEEVRESAKKRDMMLLRGVGEGGVNWLQNAVSQKDMEFLSGRKANKEEIFSTLAPGAASILDVNATEANAQAGRAVLAGLAIYPMLVTMAEKITAQILPLYDDSLEGGKLEGEFEDCRITDREMELREIEEYSKTHKIKEIRADKYNDEPLGDERDDLLPSQVTTDTGKVVEKVVQQPVPIEPQLNQPPIDPAQVKALVELDRWEAKCIKAGKMVAWHNQDIPSDLYESVKSKAVGFPAARQALKTNNSPVAIPPYHPVIQGILEEMQKINAKG
jgi:hypothetical protein